MACRIVHAEYVLNKQGMVGWARTRCCVRTFAASSWMDFQNRKKYQGNKIGFVGWVGWVGEEWYWMEVSISPRRKHNFPPRLLRLVTN